MINYNLMQQIQPGRVVAELPASGGGGEDGGIGDLLSGLQGLMGGISGAVGGSGSSSPVMVDTPSVSDYTGGYTGSNVSNYQPVYQPNIMPQEDLMGYSSIQPGQISNSIGYDSNNSFNNQNSYGSNHIKPTLLQDAIQKGANINGMNPELMSRTNQLMVDLRKQGFQPVIASANRTRAEQAQKVSQGYSKTMNSNHIGGGAVDIIDKRWGWDDKKFNKEIGSFAEAMARTAPKYGLFSGTQWKSFGPYGDFAHMQLPKNQNTKQQYQALGETSTTQTNYNLKDVHPELPYTLNGIANVESAGAKNPYAVTSIPSRNGDRAYGKYQIMGNNIPSWTKAATGKSYSPQEFVNNPNVQEQTAAFMVNQNLQKGYSPQDTASIWFSGRPAKKAGNARDAYGTTVPQYINKFNKGYLKSKEGLTLNDEQPLPNGMPVPFKQQSPRRLQPLPKEVNDPRMLVASNNTTPTVVNGEWQMPPNTIYPIQQAPVNQSGDPNSGSMMPVSNGGIKWDLLSTLVGRNMV